MAAVHKLETEVELKASANKFYEIFSKKVHHIPNVADNMHSVDVHDGDWETPGSIKLWKYTIDGRTEVFKEKVDFDDEHKTITFVALEGSDVLNHWKSYKAILHVVQNDDGHGLLKATIEYEKNNEDDDTLPQNYQELLVNVVKDVDAHLVQA